MKTQIRYSPHVQNKYSFKCVYKYANFSHEIFVELKKESLVVDVATSN